MKILLVSMPSIHVKRWVENINIEDHEIYWFDVLNRGAFSLNPKITDIVGWQTRKINYVKGEYTLSKKFPYIYNLIERYFQVSIDEALTKIIKEKNIDIIHSFEMQDCSYPILKTMKKHPNVKWIYSCWGTDIYYFSRFKSHENKIKNVLKRVNILHTDCYRDFVLAKSLGFKGQYSGVIPGGGGFEIQQFKKFRQPLASRKVILVKGYQHLFGRGLTVIKALELIQEEVKDFEVLVYGTHSDISNYIEYKKLPFTYFGRHNLLHYEVLEWLGRSLIHIGNSISDGCSNTLLEALIMGAFPIQSNPGGVGEEIITSSNGLLIQDPDDIYEIKELILKAINDNLLLEKAYIHNTTTMSEMLDKVKFSQKINNLYTR